MLGIGITAGAVGLVVWWVDLDQLLPALKMAKGWNLLAGVGLLLLSLVTRATAWFVLLGGQVAWLRVFFTMNVGYLFNNLLPFRLGEIGRALLLDRLTDLKFWQVASTILIERAFDLILTSGLVLGLIPLIIGVEWARAAAVGLGSVVLLGILFLFGLARNRERVSSWLDILGARWPWVQRLTAQRFESFVSGLSALIDVRRFVTVFCLMTLVWLFLLGEHVIVLRAYLPQASWVWAGFALGVSAMGVVVPSSPGFVGVVEASIMGALAIFRVNPAQSLAFALSVHAFYVLITILLGMIGLFREGESLMHVYRMIRQSRQRKPRST